jgi:hypothetical protein
MIEFLSGSWRSVSNHHQPRKDSTMKRGMILVSLVVGFILLGGPWTAATADDGKSDFALFDGTNPANVESGAICGAKNLKGKTFTYHVTVSNHASGSAGFVRLTYKDGDFVQFPLAPDASFSFSQAGGSKGGADRAVRVSNGGSGAKLVGAMSAIGTESKPFCVSCDAVSEGGIGAAACDLIVPN